MPINQSYERINNSKTSLAFVPTNCHLPDVRLNSFEVNDGTANPLLPGLIGIVSTNAAPGKSAFYSDEILCTLSESEDKLNEISIKGFGVEGWKIIRGKIWAM